MDALKVSLTEMMTLFENRMSNFEAELHKNPSGTSSSTDSLSEDFSTLKQFILEALGCLQQQVDMLAKGLDNLEMRGRRKMLLFHGISEQAKEDTAQVVAEVVRGQLKFDEFTVADINRCHRMGRQASDSKPRPILCKLRDINVRDSVWFAKTKLKGSGITVSEFLTRSRHQLFMSGREKFGINNCWTKQGLVYVLGSDGSRHRIGSLDDLKNIERVGETVMSPLASVPLSSSSPSQETKKKARRVAAKRR